MLIDYLGNKIKDDAVLELLEDHQMELVYHVDRTHENMPDRYSAAARAAGFELLFDEDQLLQTIFCYVEPRDGFAPVDLSTVGAPVFESLALAKVGAANLGVSFKHNDGMQFLGRRLSWVSFELGKHKFHYEYSPDALAVISLSLSGAKC
jgi:hypothetical protein